jgi:hypothetical protein
MSAIADWDPAQIATVLTGVSFVTIGALLVIFARIWPAWRTISALEKTAASIPPAASTPDAVQPAAAA